MSGVRRRASARHSVTKSQIFNGTCTSITSPGVENARDMLSQALEDVEALPVHLSDRNSAFSQSAALNAMASGSAYLPEFEDELLANNMAVKSEPDDYSDADSPGHKNKRFRFRSRRSRKRKIQEDIPSPLPAPSPYTVKLFDRSVDLSAFDASTPLYVLCRAWVRNPHSNANGSDDNDEEGAIENKSTNNDAYDDQAIFDLPAPKPCDRDMRIPDSLEKPDATSDEIDNAINSFSDKPLHELLEQNQSRWKSVRQQWTRSAALNEARYKSSLDLLKSMYARTINSQTASVET